jgi:hypothetical protein
MSSRIPVTDRLRKMTSLHDAEWRLSVHQIVNCHLGGILADYPLVHLIDNCRLGASTFYITRCTKMASAGTTPFYGREHELQRLQELSSKKTASLVIIKGRRRIGKSRLATELARRGNAVLRRSFRLALTALRPLPRIGIATSM